MCVRICVLCRRLSSRPQCPDNNCVYVHACTLQASLIEDGLSPAQGMVLHLMDQTHTQLKAGGDTADITSSADHEDIVASEAIIDVPSSVLSTLDVKFWSSGRKRGSLAVPKMSASRLLGLIQQCGCSDSQQDAGALQVRSICWMTRYIFLSVSM